MTSTPEVRKIKKQEIKEFSKFTSELQTAYTDPDEMACDVDLAILLRLLYRGIVATTSRLVGTLLYLKRNHFR